MTQSPSLSQVIEAAINERLDSFWTAMPVRVTSYDPAAQRANIQLMVTSAHEDGSGKKFWLKPNIYDVPVVFPGGHSKEGNKFYGITYPLGGIDNGLYIVTTLPTQQWQSTGGYADIDLEEDRGSRNNLSAGFLIPSVSARKYVPVSAPTDAMVLWGDKVKIGGKDGTEPAVLGNTYLSAEDTFLSALATFVDALSAQAAPVGPYPNPTLVTAATTLKTAISTFRGGTYKTTNTEIK